MMKSETLNIDRHELRCEIFESELKIDSRDSRPVLVLSFMLGRYYSDFLLGLGERFWISVAKQYLMSKSQVAAKASDEIVGRISFECDDTRVEVEFTRLTRDVLRTLHLVVAFVSQYPRSEEIRMVREGPIRVRFRNPKVDSTAEATIGKETRIKAWLATVGQRAKVISLRSRK
jgi:hypothetical protein